MTTLQYLEEPKPCPFCGRLPNMCDNWDMVYCSNEQCPLCGYPVFLEGWNMCRHYEDKVDCEDK